MSCMLQDRKATVVVSEWLVLRHNCNRILEAKVNIVR